MIRTRFHVKHTAVSTKQPHLNFFKQIQFRLSRDSLSYILTSNKNDFKITLNINKYGGKAI